jgi:small redox-active disulfide protein 2
MLNIKVLGPGCTNCKKVEEVARKVVNTMGLNAEVQKVTDQLQIMNYRLLGTPGLVVNEKVVCAGRIPSEAEVTTWLVDAEMASS